MKIRKAAVTDGLLLSTLCRDAQQHGVGSVLMNQVEVLAQELGVTRIQLGSWDFNRKAHTFFEKHGFVKIEHRFWRNLE